VFLTPHILVDGPAESGKTCFLQQLLLTNRSRRIGATRCRVGPGGPVRVREAGDDAEARRILEAGAALFRRVIHPDGTPGVLEQALLGLAEEMDARAWIHEVDVVPDISPDLTVYVTRPLGKGRGLLVDSGLTSDELADAVMKQFPVPRWSVRGIGSNPAVRRRMLRSVFGRCDDLRLVRASHEGIRRAAVVVVNVSGEEERQAAKRLIADLEEIDRSFNTAAHLLGLMQAWPKRRTVYVADLLDRRDPQLKKAIASVKRRLPRGRSRRTRRPRTAHPVQALVLRITLTGTERPIWRRIALPATATFWDLHVAVQDAMGWRDCHLHLFTTPGARGRRFGIPDEYEDLGIEPGWDHGVLPYLGRPGDEVEYEYDFGDAWIHRIVLDDVWSPDSEAFDPVCLGGEGRCPPEDVGGVDGYEEFLAAIGDPDHPEHAAYLDWIGGEFDPSEFVPEEVVFHDPRARLRRLGI